MSLLIVLALGPNKLSGTITEQVGQLRQLTELFVGPDKLSGTNTEQVGQLSLLTTLGLGASQLAGTITEQVGQLRQLISTRLGNQSVVRPGTITERVGQLRLLTTLTRKPFKSPWCTKQPSCSMGLRHQSAICGNHCCLGSGLLRGCSSSATGPGRSLCWLACQCRV